MVCGTGVNITIVSKDLWTVFEVRKHNHYWCWEFSEQEIDGKGELRHRGPSTVAK